MNVVELVERATKQCGSVRALAKELGVTEPAIYAWRSGSKPRAAMLSAIATLVGETLPTPIDEANDRPVRARQPRAPKPKPRAIARKAVPIPQPGRIKFRDLATALEVRAEVCGNAAKALRELEQRCPELFG